MPKLDLTALAALKGFGGEIIALKGPGFAWTKPAPLGGPQPALSFAPTAVVICGASLMASVAGDDLVTQHSQTTSALLSAGVDLPVYGHAVASETISQTTLRVAEALAAHPGALVIVHTGGNNVSQSRPYPGGEAGMTADYAALFDLADQHPGQVYVSSVSFRDYDDLTFQDPSLGSRPYNESLLIPMIEARAAYAMSLGRPVLDLYRLVLEQHETFLQADNIHWSSPGIVLARDYLMQRVADLISGTPVQPIEERVYDPSATGGLVLFNFGDAVGYSYYETNTDMTLVKVLYDVNGNATPWTIDWGGSRNLQNSNRVVGIPYDGTSIYCDEMLARCAYFNTDRTILLAGLTPGGSYRLGFVGARNSGETRIVQVTDGTVTLSWDTYAAPPALPVEAVFTAGAQGEILLTLSVLSGAYGYISAMSIEEV
jgi:hypothetical protein